jgi:cell division protein FtsL
MEMTRECAGYGYGYGRPDRFDEAPVRPKAAARPAKKASAAARRTLVLVMATVVAAMCIGLVYMKARVYMAQREVNDIQARIKTAQREGSVLSEQLSEAMNVNSIMSRAQALGMAYPSGDQVLYVAPGAARQSVEMKNDN